MTLGEELHRRHFIHHVTFDHKFKDERLFYRLLGDGHTRALNAKLSYACIPRPGQSVSWWKIFVRAYYIFCNLLDVVYLLILFSLSLLSISSAPSLLLLSFPILSSFLSPTATEVADDLRRYILEIYAEHLSPDGFVRLHVVHMCTCTCIALHLHVTL